MEAGMATERRTLIDGLKATPPAIDPGREKKFVYADKPPKPQPQPTQQTPVMDRVPLSTRMRGDFAKALKKASLERQLEGVEPNTLQDILEEAVEPWLKSNEYLT
jgi:hypothetical protein